MASMDLIEFQYIMKKLEEKQIPPGFERELIIIGNHAYGVVEKIQQFLGKRQVTKEISKVSVIPEGIFFAKDYSPRILTEGNKILAVEFLKRTSQTKDKVSEGDFDDKEDEDGYFPFPYIFKPPSPPGDLSLAGEPQVKPPKIGEELQNEPYCKHCGSILPEGQTICHVCGKRVG